jgi:nucleoside-diphosphate-sugar epimerase
LPECRGPVTATRVLVTGASGFLGAHLVAALAGRGHCVTAMVRAGSDLGRLRRLAPDVTPATCGLGDHDRLTEVFAEASPETVYHLAGDTGVRHFDGDWEVVDRALEANVTGALNVVRAAIAVGSVRRIIRTGGLEEYGGGASPSGEEQREAPASPYSASQVTVTHWFTMLQAHTEVMLTTLRPALIYGPEQAVDFLIPALIRSLSAGDRFAMGDGAQRRDLLYVDDMIRAFLLAGGRDDLHGALVNIASGEGVQMADVARTLARMLRAEDRLDIGARPPRAMDLDEVSGRNELAAARLDWRPEVALEDGLARTLAWYRALTASGRAKEEPQ